MSRMSLSALLSEEAAGNFHESQVLAMHCGLRPCGTAGASRGPRHVGRRLPSTLHLVWLCQAHPAKIGFQISHARYIDVSGQVGIVEGHPAAVT